MIRVHNLVHSYGASDFVLRVPKLELETNSRNALIGPSGSGKSTLLQLICGAIVPEAGSVDVDGTCIDRLSDAERRKFRVTSIGFVFQEFELLEYLPVAENILVPFLINGSLKRTSTTNQRLEELATRVGLRNKLNRWPHQLSTGEKQRVAVCRALLTNPKLILADEPTGSLDPSTAAEIMDLLLEQSQHCGATLLVVTHDRSLLRRFDRTIDLLSLDSNLPKDAEA